MALKKVRGNIERMFDKNLTDLVRGIRNSKENEVCFRVIFQTPNEMSWYCVDLFIDFFKTFYMVAGQIHCSVYGRN